MNKRTASFLAVALALMLLCTACADSKAPPRNGPLRSASPLVLTPKADSVEVYGDGIVTLDASHTGDGYFMLRYTGTAVKAKAVVAAPDGTTCSYPLIADGDYHAIPLTFGAGTYSITGYEGIPSDVRNDLYAVVFSHTLSVASVDEFLPFLYPNQYVDFTATSQAVSKGQELAGDSYSDIEVITKVYNYVTENVSYDTNLAQNVSFGYVPDVDNTLATGTGICFDYAALMTSMLRSQRIPTKLVVGYSGEALHAWISAYVEESGWVNSIISFDGKAWTLMDPTLAANNESSRAVQEYIGDGSKYLVKYQY